MGLLDSLKGVIRRWPASTGPWLRDHLARIAPHDGAAAPDGDTLKQLLDELDDWAIELHNNPQADLWPDMLTEWQRVSSPEAIAAAMRRFGDLKWIHNEVNVRFLQSSGSRGLGLGYLHDEFVRAGLVEGPRLITLKIWKQQKPENGEDS